MAFLSYLISGISLGSIYAIIALGYSMVYGIAKMLNFAHGDIIMIGAYVVFFAVTSYNMNPILAVVIAILVCCVLGLLIEKLAYKPLRNSSSLAVLITAIGVSYFLQNGAQIIFGSNSKVFPNIITSKNFVLFNGKLNISLLTIITVIVCLITMIALKVFVSKTNIGKAMRACSQDRDAATLMGINTNKTISITFAIGSGLAAIAAVLLCCSYTTVYPTLGSMPGIKAFTAAVLGGIGSIEGALVGGILLGIIEILSKAYISSQLSDAIVFAILIIILLIKPSGLLGKKKVEKV